MKKTIILFLILSMMNTVSIYAADSILNNDIINENQMLKQELKKKDKINSRLIRRISVYENKLNSEITNLKNQNEKLISDLDKNKTELMNTRLDNEGYHSKQNIIFGTFIFILIILNLIMFALLRNKIFTFLEDSRCNLDHDIRLSELLQNQIAIMNK